MSTEIKDILAQVRFNLDNDCLNDSDHLAVIREFMADIRRCLYVLAQVVADLDEVEEMYAKQPQDKDLSGG